VLSKAFAERFDLEMQAGDLTDAEHSSAEAIYREEIGTDDFVAEIEEPPAARGDLSGSRNSPGGTITTYLRLEGPAQNRVRAALITGDFFITPPRVIYDLESRLRGVYLDELTGVIRTFFEESQVEVLSVSPDDFIASVENALAGE